jgi:hypothetical protein
MVFGSVLGNTESAQHLYLYTTQQQQQHMDDSPLTVLSSHTAQKPAGSPRPLPVPLLGTCTGLSASAYSTSHLDLPHYGLSDTQVASAFPILIT